jgi:hypothetical protein
MLAFTASSVSAHFHGARLQGRTQTRARCAYTRMRASGQRAGHAGHEKLLTVSAVCAAAAQRGLVLTDATAGPLVRFDAAWAASGETAGAISGATLPGGRLHIESYRAVARRGRRGAGNDAAGGGALLHLSPGMLLFAAAIAAGAQKGCRAVYGLAIDDAPEQHARLVRYLQRFGGVPMRRVGDAFRDIPDRVLYGGKGTVICGDIPAMLAKAADMIQRTSPPSPRCQTSNGHNKHIKDNTGQNV